MKKPARSELVPSKRPPGRPKKLFDLAKLAGVKVLAPESLAQAIEQLVIFDSRFADAETCRELVKIMPQLLIMRRAWRAHYAEYGCISCHKKRAPYQCGGLCVRCQGRLIQRMLNCFRNVGAGRDLNEELSSISRKYDAAQKLLNGDD